MRSSVPCAKFDLPQGTSASKDDAGNLGGPLAVDILFPDSFARALSERSAMPAPKEIEVKLELPPASLPRFKKIPLLRAQKGRPKSATEVSVYFDTDKHKLHKKGMMLRVRRSGDRYVQTIKSAGNSGPFARDEWESEI